MKINKISQKILASVLMIAVLICGMFFLTACGEDEDKNTELNKRITDLQNQLNNTNETIQEMQPFLDFLILEQVKDCLSGMMTELSQPLTKLATPVERTTSSIGVAYEGNYTSGIEIGGSGVIENRVNSYRDSAKKSVERIHQVMNSSQFKEGALYQDLYTETLGCHFIVTIDKTNKIVNFLCKDFYVETNKEKSFYSIAIKLNDSYSDWISYTEMVDANSPYSPTSRQKSLKIIENGKSNGIATNAVNTIFGVENETVQGLESFDFDTDYYVMAVGNEVSSSVSQSILEKYGNELNAVKTNVDNALNGKTVYGELDIFTID